MYSQKDIDKARAYGYLEAFEDVKSSLEYLKYQNYQSYKDDRANGPIDKIIDYINVIEDIEMKGLDIAMDNLEKSKEGKA